MSRDLIVFGEDWGGLPSSTQHLMKHLARDRKILWINSIGLRRPRCSRHDITRALMKVGRKVMSGIGADITTVSPPKNITTMNPITLPAPRHSLERRGAAYLLEKQLRPKVEALDLENPLLWVSLPTAVDMIGRLGDSGVVYYCGDDFFNLAGVDHRTVGQRERELVAFSDVIITASDTLSERFPKHKTHTLTHGVDFELFSHPTARASDLPDNGRPTAGFYGSLSAWLHTELLAEVIATVPHWNFVFIGNEAADMSALKGHHNTFFLGPRPHSDLPSYSQHWQASLLPFRDNAQIRACNPLKLSEYLASGTPIVTTGFPALNPYRHLVHNTESAADFAEALELSTHLSMVKHFSAASQNSVASNTWQAKARQVSNWLEAI